MHKYSHIELKDKIIASGLKATHQRIVIYAALMETHEHPTAEKIFDKITKDNPAISLGTVYKTLDALVAVKLVKKVKSDEGSYRYDANTDNHNHIYLVNTDEIMDYEDQELDQLILNYFKTKKVKNLKIKDIRLQIHAERIDSKKEISIQ